jgi:hypothetical protein
MSLLNAVPITFITNNTDNVCFVNRIKLSNVLPNGNGDEIVGSVSQMLGGREHLQILHLEHVTFH